MTPLLEVRDLHAGYGDTSVLNGVNLVVNEGEIVGLIGPNGAGKSSVLKSLVGFLRIHEGSLTFGGRDLTTIPTQQLLGLGIGYVPQVQNVFPSLTVYENLEIAARSAEGRNRIAEILQLFPRLQERRRTRAGLLSGGERQMLALGRALITTPRILLLDEPSAALSPGLAKEVFQKIAEINRAGTTVLLVEQNARQALKLSDRAYILENGRNALDGTGSDLLDDPKVGALYLGGAASH